MTFRYHGYCLCKHDDDNHEHTHEDNTDLVSESSADEKSDSYAEFNTHLATEPGPDFDSKLDPNSNANPTCVVFDMCTRL